jgi:hypothetical protein
MPSKPLLNPFHEHFCRNVAFTGQLRRDCVQQARIACGLPRYSASVASATATSLMYKPDIVARIAELRLEEVQHATQPHPAYVATRDWIVDKLVANVLEARADHNYTAVNKALHLLGLEVGMFATVIKHGIATDVQQLTDAELHVIARGDQPANGGNGADPTATDQTKLN